MATLKQVDDSALDLLSQLIDEALEQAMLRISVAWPGATFAFI